MRVLVCSGDQTGLTRFVQASTTTETFIAQERVKPNPLVCAPKFGPLFRISGFGSDQSEVGRPPKVEPQPAAPGK